MTEDVNIANVNVSTTETEEKYGLDMREHRDPPTATAALSDINGVKEENENGKGNMEDDPDASYVFVGGNDVDADTPDRPAKSELAGNVGSSDKEVDNKVAEPEVVDHNSSMLESHPDAKGEDGPKEVPNGTVVIETHELDGQDLAVDVQGTQKSQVPISEPIGCEPELVQDTGSDAKAEEDNLDSIVTPEFQVKSSMDVAESEPNQSGNTEVTSSKSIAESELNQYDNDEALESAGVSKSESNQSGIVEVTGNTNFSESELNQSGNDEAIDSACLAKSEPVQFGNLGVTDSGSLSESELNQSCNNEVLGSANVSESESNQSGKVEVTGSMNISESESNQSDNGEVIGSADVSEFESNQSGKVEVTGSMNISESESNQSDNGEVIGSADVSESESNQSGKVEVTGSMNISESESNQSDNGEVIGSANVSESESNQSGNLEVTGSMNIPESEWNQSGDDEVICSANLAESESNQSGNVGVIGTSNVAESESNQSGNIEVTGSANDTESEQTQSGVGDKVEGDSKLNLVTDRKENQDFPVSITEDVQNNNDLDLDQEVELVVLTNNLPVNSPQTASELEQNLETATSLVITEVELGGAEAADASSVGEYTNGWSAGHAEGHVAEKDVANDFVYASQNTNEQNGCSEEVEISVPSDAEIGGNEASAFSDAETGKGFLAAVDNDAISGPTDDFIASVVQLDSEAVADHITYENGGILPTDHAEKIDLQTVVDDLTHASQTSPKGNRRSEVVKSLSHDNGAIESYESDPVAPASDTALKSFVEIGDSCPVDNTEIRDGMEMETVVEKLDVDSSGSLSSHPVSVREVVIEPECDLLTNDKMSSSPGNDAKPETDSDSIAIVSEEKVSSLPSGEVDLEAEFLVQLLNALAGNLYQLSILLERPPEVEKTVIDDHHASESENLPGSIVTSQSTLNCIQVDIHVEDRGNEFVSIDSDEKTPQEMEVTEAVNREQASTSSPEGSAADASDGQNSVVEVVKRPFYYMIRIPRYDDDENLKEQIKHAQDQVDEKTRSRDAIRAEMQSQRANCNKYGASVAAAISEETSARDLLKAKRKEIDSVLLVINKGKSASELKIIDEKIHGMEHKIQHETMPLREEKNYILEIKKLKQAREKLFFNFGSQGDVQEAIDQQVQFEERLKILRKEADLLRENALKAEAATKNVEKKYQEEKAKLGELIGRFRAADDIRQEAFAHLQSLRKRLYDKHKNFYKYKEDAKAASDLASKGDQGELQYHCVNQVERVMELWNNNDEFRKDYIRCNLRSTVRRLRTLDGRSLGPDEEPPVIPNFVSERFARRNVVPSISTLQEEKIIAPTETENKDDKSIAKVKNPTAKSKKPAKHALGNSMATVSNRVEIEEEGVEEHKLTKEEEELARKAEELRKEEEAATLKERQLLEAKTKANEALERKKRSANKAQARAEVRARKEAEQKEKEKEKRARKKEKRRALEAANGSNEGESAPSSETPTDTKESETIEKPVALRKRSQKPLHFAKQTKPKIKPPPLRNRGKRRMQTWMWVLLTITIIFALFLIGNGSFSLQRFGF
eukprot:XP_015573456.1 uncharacterized protein LOC8269958 [Ricinus communis]